MDRNQQNGLFAWKAAEIISGGQFEIYSNIFSKFRERWRMLQFGSSPCCAVGKLREVIDPKNSLYRNLLLLGILKHSFLLVCRSYSITLQKLLKDNCNKESTVGANCVPTQQNTGRSLPSRAGNPILFDLLTLTFWPQLYLSQIQIQFV